MTVNIQSTYILMQLVGLSCKTPSISRVEVKSEEIEDNTLLLAVDTTPNVSAQKQKEDGSICDKEVKVCFPLL